MYSYVPLRSFLVIKCDQFFLFKIFANPENYEYPEPHPPVPPTPPPTTEEPTEEDNEDTPTIIGHWDTRLSTFQKLVLIKSFREEKVHRNNQQLTIKS